MLFPHTFSKNLEGLNCMPNGNSSIIMPTTTHHRYSFSGKAVVGGAGFWLAFRLLFVRVFNIWACSVGFKSGDLAGFFIFQRSSASRVCERGKSQRYMRLRLPEVHEPQFNHWYSSFASSVVIMLLLYLAVKFK
ncbi:hypothetical protein TNCV_3892511 [Trichonephila clavipes]|nr:hypothetical protein TNCV_3892511 [Trichonephila clavipes]